MIMMILVQSLRSMLQVQECRWFLELLVHNILSRVQIRGPVNFNRLNWLKVKLKKENTSIVGDHNRQIERFDR